MADQQRPVQEDSGWKRAMRAVGIADPYIDAGILAGLAALWFRMSGGRGGSGTMMPGNTVAESVAPTQADEGNLDTLLVVLEEGGVHGCICADQINGVHSACLSIHHDYAKQFRNFFFSTSGVKIEETFKKLQELLEKLCAEDDDNTKWVMLSKSPTFPIRRTLKLCKEIEQEVKKFHPNHMSYEEASKHAYLIIARRMIDDKRLPGSLTTHTEERFDKTSDSLNHFLQGRIQKRNEKKVIEIDQEKKTDRVKIAKIVMAIIFFIFLSITLYSASTAPTKNDTVNPLGSLENKISNKVGIIYQTITKEEGE